MKKAKKFIKIDSGSDVDYGVSVTDGSIHTIYDNSEYGEGKEWESDGRVMTAAEAKAIGIESAIRAKSKDRVPSETATSYTIKIEEDGDVQVGCQYYEASEVARVVKLSQKFAATKKGKR